MTLVWLKRDAYDWPVGYTYVLVFALAALWARFILPNLQAVCLFKRTFGIPCPTCGMTRQLTHLWSLEFIDALICNPGGLIAMAAVVTFFCMEIVGFHTGKKPVIRIKPNGKRWLIIGFLILAFANWGYLILAGM